MGIPVAPLNLSEGRNRDYDAERRSADERREHRSMAEGFGNIQKIVDEEMNEDGSDMCHILRLVAMAFFRSAAVRSWGRHHRRISSGSLLTS